MFDLARRWWPLAVIVLAALWLRTHELDRRPMHFDEANQAYKTGELLESGRYRFDPRDHHGPTLYFAALPVAWLRGERTLAELSETTVRLVPALFGTASVVLVCLLATGRRRERADATPRTGDGGPAVPWPAIAAAAFVAFAPPAVYYSRYYIQETLLATLTLAVMLCGRGWWRSGRPGWAVALGAMAGLMQATKASAPLFLLAAALAGALTEWVFHDRSVARRADASNPPRPWARDGGLALLSAIVVAGLFYSSFGTNPRGMVDAVRAYTLAFERFGADAGPTGHEKPWWYYLQLFGWIRSGGLVWHQVAFSGLALAGLVMGAVGFAGALVKRRASGATDSRPLSRRGTLAIWAGVYTLVIMAAFSALPYKTPWHAVHFVPGMALLGACVLRAVSRLDAGRYVAIALALVTTGTLYQQTARAAFLRPADSRNPYAYVHSSADVLKFRPLAEAALARAPGAPIRVISEEIWPLPWYFRGLPNVGYWSDVPADCDGALVIVSQAKFEAVEARLKGKYRSSILGLRPGFLCIVYTPEP